MNIFFDMDYTILSVTGSLRPKTKEVFQQLKDDGLTLFIWSGVGERPEDVRRLGLDIYVDGVFAKPLYDYRQQVQGMLRRQEISVFPDLIIDDYPEIVSAIGGIVIRPYFEDRPTDREMERVYQIIKDYATSGSSKDDSFRPRPQEAEA